MRDEFVKECSEHIREGARRIVKCLDMLTLEQVWYNHPSVVSVGNQVLHLEGNVSQWILQVLGEQSYTRNRSNEFTASEQLSISELKNRIQRVTASAANVIDKATLEQLQKTYEVQIFNPTGVGIVVHAVEHFSYHVGQITLLTKLATGEHTHYYDESKL